MQPPKIRIGLADVSFTTSIGELTKVPMKIGNCIVLVDFQVATMQNHSIAPLIRGRSFLATTEAIMDWPNVRISFANIDKKTFYSTAPPGFPAKRVRHAISEKKVKESRILLTNILVWRKMK